MFASSGLNFPEFGEAIEEGEGSTFSLRDSSSMPSAFCSRGSIPRGGAIFRDVIDGYFGIVLLGPLLLALRAKSIHIVVLCILTLAVPIASVTAAFFLLAALGQVWGM